MASSIENPLYNRNESAEYVRSTPPTMDRWRQTGSGPEFIKIGHRVFYQKSALDAFIARQRRTHTGATGVAQAAV